LQMLGYVLAALLVLGGLAFVIDVSALYLVLEVSLVALLVWAASAGWVIGRSATG
jgi:hypothetical protein